MNASAASFQPATQLVTRANDERDARARRLAMQYSGEDALEILRVAIKEEFPLAQNRRRCCTLLRKSTRLYRSSSSTRASISRRL